LPVPPVTVPFGFGFAIVACGVATGGSVPPGRGAVAF
jgi:hypothetical protein